MESCIILVRGVPGAGKSTTAYKLMNHFTGLRVHLESDDFFIVRGEYRFEGSKLKWAHMHCQAQTARFLNAGMKVIVSNTFITVSDMEPYFEIAKAFRVPVYILECNGNFKNIHGVSDEVLEEKRSRWQQFPKDTYNNVTLVKFEDLVDQERNINIR
jgi:predicted kinase